MLTRAGVQRASVAIRSGATRQDRGKTYLQMVGELGINTFATSRSGRPNRLQAGGPATGSKPRKDYAWLARSLPQRHLHALRPALAATLDLYALPMVLDLRRKAQARPVAKPHSIGRSSHRTASTSIEGKQGMTSRTTPKPAKYERSSGGGGAGSIHPGAKQDGLEIDASSATRTPGPRRESSDHVAGNSLRSMASLLPVQPL